MASVILAKVFGAFLMGLGANLGAWCAKKLENFRGRSEKGSESPGNP